jgi:hemolysin III
MAGVPRQYTFGEELANSITHGVALVASIAMLPVMIITAASAHDPRRVVAASVFGAMLILLYASSTLYHAIPGERRQRMKDVCQRIDHSAIYLLIAGTYTPFALVTLRGPWGWSLFGVVWGLALVGILLKSAFGARHLHALSTGVYLGMGWLAIVAIRPLIHAAEPGALVLLLAGGLLYTCGVVFYVWRRKYSHAVWHLFVMAGSAAHAWAVLGYVLPGKG